MKVKSFNKTQKEFCQKIILVLKLNKETNQTYNYKIQLLKIRLAVE